MTQAVQTLIIFGASGDLTSRLLLPALGQVLTKDPGRRVTLIGAGSEDWTAAHWKHVVRTSFATSKAEGPAVDALLASTEYVSLDVTVPADLKALLARAKGTPALYF